MVDEPQSPLAPEPPSRLHPRGYLNSCDEPCICSRLGAALLNVWRRASVPRNAARSDRTPFAVPAFMRVSGW